jgi:aldose 1-epimerase
MIRNYSLSTKNGAYLELNNYGARMQKLVVPDGCGELSDILLGYPNAQDYVRDNSYLGATIGRFANRIAGGTFQLAGKIYHLEQNEGQNTNHGGFHGFDRRIWDGYYKDGKVVFSLHSSDGEAGFPAAMDIKLEYGFTEDGVVTIDYYAESDRDGILNLTNHAYFNLDGNADILAHSLEINARQMVETDSSFIPTGRILPVEGTPFDFTRKKAIGADIQAPIDQLQWNRGYNHTYVLSMIDDRTLKHAATAESAVSRRRLDVFTTYPSVLFYSAGYLKTEICGKHGVPYFPSHGFCLESQYYPDTPNHCNFPSCAISPQHPYHHRIEYRIKSF